MSILICGGAGYIGSHTSAMASESNFNVAVLDNLSTGNSESLCGLKFYKGEISDRKLLLDIFRSSHYETVIHFSAFSEVNESLSNPQKYYLNNLCGTVALLDTMLECGIANIVFSSTAAVYGSPDSTPIMESHEKRPISPYGRSKLMIENILLDYYQAYGLNSISLRYFNAAGAHPSGRIGEKHRPETHLIPNILKSVLRGGDSILSIYGNDYPTPDGTCVRDYIHVNDLASAHLLATDYLAKNPGAYAFNLGMGKGFSVMEVINAAESVVGRSIKYEICDRRQGDPPILVADSALARQKLGWSPTYTNIERIIDTAWNWHKNGETFT